MKNPSDPPPVIKDDLGREIRLDALSRPAKILYPDGKTVAFYYDSAGNVAKMLDSTQGTTAYQFDPLNRPMRIVLPDGRTVESKYDAVGNRTAFIGPGNRSVHYAYNANDGLTEIRLGHRVVRVDYDPLGRPIRKSLPNGLQEVNEYNAAGRLVRLTLTRLNGPKLLESSYSYDAVGNCLKVARTDGGGKAELVCKYDRQYRLKVVKYSRGGIASYQYDASGNRILGQVSPTQFPLNHIAHAFRSLGLFCRKTAYSYDAEDRLRQANEVQFEYDERGNLSKRSTAKGAEKYIFNRDNQLVKIEFPDGTYAAYQYDAVGRRVCRKTRLGVVTNYIYDGPNLIQELDDKRLVISDYFYGAGIDHPVAISRQGKIYYFHYDHIGSVIALTDETGKIVVEYEYDAWGNIIKEIGDLENPFRFTGREWDKESGFYYYRARYYDPCIGRFISKDQITGNPLNPESLSRYVYVNNNPQTYVDPFGLIPTSLLKELANFLSGTGIEILKAGGSTLSNFASGLKSITKLTDLAPSFFNADPLTAFTSVVHGGTSILGSLYAAPLGAAKGAAWGAAAGFAVGNLPGAFVGSILGGAVTSHKDDPGASHKHDPGSPGVC